MSGNREEAEFDRPHVFDVGRSPNRHLSFGRGGPHLTGAFHTARAALPHLVAARGAVVAVASSAALRASSGMGGYAVTKAGLTMLVQSLAVDHGHQGLRANVVCPGWTVTEMADEEMAAFGASRGGLAVGDAYSLVTSLVPQRWAARAVEVAAVVTWLLSDAASYVNGAVIPVDGADGAVDVGTLPVDPGSRSGVRTARSRPCSAAGAGRAPSARRCPCPWDG